MPIKHVCFDCDGTLYEYTSGLVNSTQEVISEYLSKKLEIPKTDVIYEYLNRVKKYKTKTRAITSYGFSEEQARDIINMVDIASFVKPDKKLVSVLSDLKTDKMSISIFTNNKKQTLDKILEKLGVSGLGFDFAITAEDAPPKPAIEGYLNVIEKSKVSVFEILFVGDRFEADIEPAREVGMHTLQVGSQKNLIDFDERKKTYHFRRENVYDVPRVIKVVDFLMLRQ